MICPNCGVLVKGFRPTCQNCGGAVQQSAQIISNTYEPQKKKKKKRGRGLAIGISIGAIILTILISAGVMYLLTRPEPDVDLRILGHSTSGKTVTVTVRNSGTEIANETDIQIRINEETTFQWAHGNIRPGKTVYGHVELEGTIIFLKSIEIIYKGEVHDRAG